MGLLIAANRLNSTKKWSDSKFGKHARSQKRRSPGPAPPHVIVYLQMAGISRNANRLLKKYRGPRCALIFGLARRVGEDGVNPIEPGRRRRPRLGKVSAVFRPERGLPF